MNGLIVDDKIVPGKAMHLLDGGFDDLLDELVEQGAVDAQAAELEAMDRSQIQAILDGTEVQIRHLECGSRVCAAELVRPAGADPRDPFYDRDAIAERLPRAGMMEITFFDAEQNALRRYMFSIDPDVNTLYVPRRPCIASIGFKRSGGARTAIRSRRDRM